MKYQGNPVVFMLKRYIRFIARVFVSVFPNSASEILGRVGFSEIIKRSPKVKFEGRLFGTKLKIYCQGNYAVERIATSRSMWKTEPFAGISKLGLNGFSMLDIGANVGAYSIGAAAIGAKIVYAIEPGPLFERLLNNIKLNSIEDFVIPIKIGLASQPGKLRWYEDKSNPGNAHLLVSKDAIDFKKIPTNFTDEYVEVDVITMLQLYERYKLPKIDIIKIDVEGMEWDVLSSGKVVIERDLPVIVAETHRVASDMMRYDCVTPIFQYLYSIGYLSYAFDGDNFVGFIYPNFSVDTFFIHKNSLYSPSK